MYRLKDRATLWTLFLRISETVDSFLCLCFVCYSETEALLETWPRLHISDFGESISYQLLSRIGREKAESFNGKRSMRITMKVKLISVSLKARYSGVIAVEPVTGACGFLLDVEMGCDRADVVQVWQCPADSSVNRLATLSLFFGSCSSFFLVEATDRCWPLAGVTMVINTKFKFIIQHFMLVEP